MFKFTTTTVINSNVYGPKKETLITSDSSKGTMQVKRVRDFKKDCVLSIYKAAGFESSLGKAVITLPTAGLEKGSYRLALYIRMHGSENPYYANDLVFKGKPFYVEFTVKDGETAAAIATKVATLATKYMAMVYEDALLDVTASSNVITITGTDPHQRFTKVSLEKYTVDTTSYTPAAWDGRFLPVLEASKIADIDPKTGTLATAREIADIETLTGASIEIQNGSEGFGDYVHLMKDYRLPTAANTRWIKIHNDETPILGGIYDQYVITYCTNRGIMGTAAVGQPAKSITQSVFWVLKDSEAQKAFEEGIKALGYTEESGASLDNAEEVGE